jgi:hypothetical protein
VRESESEECEQDDRENDRPNLAERAPDQWRERVLAHSEGAAVETGRQDSSGLRFAPTLDSETAAI